MKIRQIVRANTGDAFAQTQEKRNFLFFFRWAIKERKTVKIHSSKLKTQKNKRKIAAEVFSFFLATRFVKIQLYFIQLQL